MSGDLSRDILDRFESRIASDQQLSQETVWALTGSDDIASFGDDDELLAQVVEEAVTNR